MMNIALLRDNSKPAGAHVLLKKVAIAQDSILYMGFGLKVSSTFIHIK